MKILQWISIVLISAGGLITLIAFGSIMYGISDLSTYNVVLTVGKISGVITIMGLLCGAIRAILFSKNFQKTCDQRR